MKVLSLFSGIGGFDKAFEDVFGKDHEVYFSEIDTYAIQVYKKHFPKAIELGSITDINIDKLPQFDFIVGGSPCQDLSIAKKDRQGLEGSRSGLFWKFAEIIKKNKPKYFILENVNSMPKEAKQIITDTLGVEPIMINASLVSAQNRKRLFWTNIPNVTLPEDRGILLEDILEDGDVDRLKSYAIDTSYYKGASWNTYKEKCKRQLVKVGQFNSGGQGDRVYSPDGKSVALSANGGGRGAKTGLYAVALTETRTEEAKRIRKENMKLGRDWSPRREKELKPREDNKSNTITTGATKESLICISSTQKHATITIDKSSPLVSAMGMGGGHIPMVGNEFQIRKLTPIECARLQCFPDNWCEDGIDKNKYYGNIDICKQTVKLKTVTDKLLTENLVSVLCTIKDIKEKVVLNQEHTQKNTKINVNFAITKLENMEQKECVINTIKCGENTKTLYFQINREKKLEKHLQIMDMSEENVVTSNIERLWKISWEGNLPKEKQSIILMVIKQITELIIYTYAKVININLSIDNLKELPMNSYEITLSNLEMENIISISNTRQYKAYGNAVNVEVVKHIFNCLKTK